MSKKHLPVFGVGPLCALSMLFFFLIGVLLHHFGFLSSGRAKVLRVPFILAGLLMIALGVYIWVQAVLVSKIDRAVLENQLVTTGIYSYVRNPVYSAIAIALSGAAMLFSNFWLLILMPVFWLDITVWMKNTEEKWLKERYGKPYEDYCLKVNRCIPWFPRKNK